MPLNLEKVREFLAMFFEHFSRYGGEDEDRQDVASRDKKKRGRHEADTYGMLENQALYHGP